MNAVAEPSLEPRESLFPVADLRAYLEGAWAIRRRLDDRRGGQEGTFDGQAVFAPGEPGTLVYKEQGRLSLGGFETVSHQSYLYTFQASPKAPQGPPRQAEVRFADGRRFHDLDLGAGAWEAEHLCGADLYQGRFQALGPDRWTVAWRVTGPRKDQVLESLFTRAG